MTAYDSLWQLMTAYNSFWQLMTAYDSLWQLMRTLDNIWQCLTTFDNIWQRLTTFDNFWQLLTNYDKLWRLLTTYTCTLCKLSSSQDLVVGLVMLIFLFMFLSLWEFPNIFHSNSFSIFFRFSGQILPLKVSNNPAFMCWREFRIISSPSLVIHCHVWICECIYRTVYSNFIVEGRLNGNV